jgi:hypothetical protein
MKLSLDEIASQGAAGNYYVLAAVQAHEKVHSDDIKKACDDAFATFKATVEAMSVSQGDCSPANGVTQLSNSGQYKTALESMYQSIKAGEDAFRRRSQFSSRVVQMMWHIVFDARRVHSPAMEAVFLM